jgi:hypothetical protein
MAFGSLELIMLDNKLVIFAYFVIKVSMLLFFRCFLILFSKIMVLVDIFFYKLGF